MNLFDTSYNGKYETNHIHMVLEETIEFSEDGLKDSRLFGLFVHEYVHYYQHFATLYGSQFCKMANLLFLETRQYLSKHNHITLPFGIWVHNDKINNYVKRSKDVAGSKECGYVIDDIEIDEKEINKAKSEHRAVRIGVYDYGEDIAVEDGFRLGYFCIIEYVAHAIQKIIDSKAEHNQVPYTAVEFICRKKSPQLLHDIKQLITVCMCALMYDNPGVGFFEVLNFVNQNPELNGLEFYHEFIQTTLVSYKGKNYSMDFVGCEMLREYKDALEQQCGCQLNYYDKVIDSFICDYQEGTSGLLLWLYSGDIHDRQQFIELTKRYGVPCIECPGLITLPISPENGKPYLESATMVGFELWFRRFQKLDGDVCPWYRICKTTEYDDESKVDEYCGKEQWKKQTACIMSQTLKYYRLNNIDFVA